MAAAAVSAEDAMQEAVAATLKAGDAMALPAEETARAIEEEAGRGAGGAVPSAAGEESAAAPWALALSEELQDRLEELEVPMGSDEALAVHRVLLKVWPDPTPDAPGYPPRRSIPFQSAQRCTVWAER